MCGSDRERTDVSAVGGLCACCITRLLHLNPHPEIRRVRHPFRRLLLNCSADESTCNVVEMT
jgi:hypothetical protein